MNNSDRKEAGKKTGGMAEKAFWLFPFMAVALLLLLFFGPIGDAATMDRLALSGPVLKLATIGVGLLGSV